jgi:hypothetical protein
MILTHNKLKPVDWKQLELPTFDWRGRIFCNSWKQVLMGESYDPFEHQSVEFLRHLSEMDFPQDKPLDRRTFESWFAGNSMPSFKKKNDLLESVTAVGGNASIVSRWLEVENVSTPLLRQLRATDGRNLFVSKKLKSVVTSKSEIANSVVDAVSKVWSIYTDLISEPSGPLAYTKQVPGMVMRTASEPREARLHGLNPYAASLPDSIFRSYEKENRLSLILFLLRLGAYLSPMSDEELEVWAFDLASLAGAGLTLQYTSMSLAPSALWGEAVSECIGAVAQFFWGAEDDQLSSLVSLLECVDEEQRRQLFDALQNARYVYFDKFAQQGISEAAVMEKLFLYKVVPILPERRIALTRDGKIAVAA